MAVKLTKGMRTFLIIAVLAVAAYFAYEWYINRQSTTGGSLGANLNSVAPELVGGSTGPNSGLTYNQGSTYVYLTETGKNSSVAGNTSGTGTMTPNPHPHIIPMGIRPGV